MGSAQGHVSGVGPQIDGQLNPHFIYGEIADHTIFQSILRQVNGGLFIGKGVHQLGLVLFIKPLVFLRQLLIQLFQSRVWLLGFFWGHLFQEAFLLSGYLLGIAEGGKAGIEQNTSPHQNQHQAQYEDNLSRLIPHGVFSSFSTRRYLQSSPRLPQRRECSTTGR